MIVLWQYSEHRDVKLLFIDTVGRFVFKKSQPEYIGVNITGHTLLAPSRFPAFHLKCPTYFAYFELEKMRSMRSAQRQVELRRPGNQLPVLGKANSLCKIVKWCVFCLFRLRTSVGTIHRYIDVSRYLSRDMYRDTVCNKRDTSDLATFLRFLFECPTDTNCQSSKTYQCRMSKSSTTNRRFIQSLKSIKLCGMSVISKKWSYDLSVVTEPTCLDSSRRGDSNCFPCLRLSRTWEN